MYSRPIVADDHASPRVAIVETDIDLYYRMAVELYATLAEQTADDGPIACIVPVGPVFYLRRFVWLVQRLPIDCSRLHLFFMDEYLDDEGHLIAPDDSLSFRGFVRRELVAPLTGVNGFQTSQVYFPDPEEPHVYDERLQSLGGATVCFAGVGINGHLAFNEPPGYEDPAFRDTGTRVVELSRETITINSNTALGGAWEVIPQRAVTVGMKQILASSQLRIYLNRPWQRSVVRKLLFGPVTSTFPASYAQEHGDCTVTMTAAVAEPPEFGLR